MISEHEIIFMRKRLNNKQPLLMRDQKVLLEAYEAVRAKPSDPAADDVIEKLKHQVRQLQEMANRARGYLLERPANKTKCNVMLLRMAQMKIVTEPLTDIETVKQAINNAMTANIPEPVGDEVERVARAIHQCHFHPSDHGSKAWREIFERERLLYSNMAQAAIAAMPDNTALVRQLAESNGRIAQAARNLFDNRLGWDEGRPPYAPRYFWWVLGCMLYSPDDPRVEELRPAECQLPDKDHMPGVPQEGKHDAD